MTEVTFAKPPADVAIKRDRWGHYLIPHPETGEVLSWTRVTTVAGTLADRFALEKWDQRNIVWGLGQRQDLYAQAASCRPDDRSTLTRLVDEAKEAARAKAGANMGQALHRFTERLDAGELTPSDIGDPGFRADIEAYAQAMESHAVVVVPGWIERILLLPELQIAGTCDRLCNSMWSLPRIGDVKTGKDVVHYGMAEIPLQLALYAHATHWYDPTTKTIHEVTEKIDQERALVMHLPAGKGTCTLYEVDIAAGWDAVQLAVDVRQWRTRKDLADQMVPQAADPAFDQRLAWILARVKAVIAIPEAAQTLADMWSAHLDVPTFKAGGPTTNEQIDVIAGMCDLAEMAHELPFGGSDPSNPTITNLKEAKA